MKAIQKLFDKIDSQQKTIERMQIDRNAALASINGAGAYVATLEDLKAQRRRHLAEAMIAKKTPNTAAVDAQIANAEQQHEAAQIAATTARDALEIYDEGIRIAEAELSNLREQLQDAIGAEIVAYHDAGLEEYLAAVAAMEEGVTAMVAADRAWTQARTVLGNRPFPAHGARVLTEIRETGLRVPHTASRLADPKVAAEYTPDYPNFWFLPAWADPLTQNFAVESASSLVDGLVKAGVACIPIELPQPPEPQIKVRIKKGSISAAPKVTRSAETGKIIDQQDVTFTEGDDVWIEESMARRLRAADMVRIHGEEEMPLPKAKLDPNAPVVIDGSLPEEKRRNPQGVGYQQRPAYAGNFHKMDLSAYE